MCLLGKVSCSYNVCDSNTFYSSNECLHGIKGAKSKNYVHIKFPER